MRRFPIFVAAALLAVGCSAHSVAPELAAISPQLVQKQPLPAPNWTWVNIPFVNGKKPIPFALVSDGKSKMWFIDQANQLGSVTMSQKVTTYPLNIVPLALAYGPDRNIWIAGYGSGSNVVAKVTPTGGETDYAVPGNNGSGRITVGPDSNLWFSECESPPNVSGFGKMTPAGTFTYYPFAGTCPLAITSGSDGNLWAADYLGALDKVTTAGQETIYPTEDAPMFISPGPDGALYFTTHNSTFGRMTTDGTVTYFGVRSDIDMANGPDKRLWAGNLETFNPVNSTFKHISQYPRGGGVYALAVGPDRNIWVSSAETIGTYVRLAMTVAPTSLTISAPGQSGVLTVTETNFDGAWTAHSSSTLIATVTQPSPGTFIVTATGVGACSVAISDGNGNSVVVHVTVK
jgi:streptogramin lyase